MRALVLVEHYPDNNGDTNMMYVHVRNKYYVKNGYDVDVLCFSKKESYCYDNINVLCLSDFKTSSALQYDVLILHAANLRNHYRFLKKYGSLFKKKIFFYHGHEVLMINYTYSKPYSYMKKSLLRFVLQNIYDKYKLSVWRKYLSTHVDDTFLIFVSQWMKSQFLHWTKLNAADIDGRSAITYNCVGKTFEKETYNDKTDKEFDFVTIRGNLDNSKYSVDIVNRIAKNTPTGKFLLIGKGNIFNYIEKASNLTWINTTLNHTEITEYLNKARFALMPTRTDAQGVMMCEMAAFGIPVITSDIDVCHEVFGDFPNVFYINNGDENLCLNQYVKARTNCIKMEKYYEDNTVARELESFTHFLQQK